MPVAVVGEADIAARTLVDSYCLPMPALPVQVAEAEVHTDYTLQRVFRTEHSTHWHRARNSEHSAAEGEVDTDRMQ